MSFKLLAIRPMTNCNKKFLKSLEIGRIYKFYNDFNFFNNEIEMVDNSEKLIDKIEYNPTNPIPKSFFGKKDLNINISAVVGKNGSGKSALVELLYMSLYNISVINGILKKKIQIQFDEPEEIPKEKIIQQVTNILNETFVEENELKRYIEHIISINKNIILKRGNVIKEDFEKEIDELKEKADNQLIFDSDFNAVDKMLKNFSDFKFSSLLNYLENVKNGSNIVIENINVEIFFQYAVGKKSIIYLLKLEGKEFKFYRFNTNNHLTYDNPNILNKKATNELLKDEFFYTLAINYSFYALNSNDLGLWLKNIFHKNDSYQMPIVLNPMRKSGIIDVNTETELTKSRLLYNLFYPLVISCRCIFLNTLFSKNFIKSHPHALPTVLKFDYI